MWQLSLANNQLLKFTPFGVPKSKFNSSNIDWKSYSKFFPILINNNFVFNSGKSYFKGPWFISPPEIPGVATRLFYRQEVLLSTTQDVSPTVAIIGLCAVLEPTEYSSCK